MDRIIFMGMLLSEKGIGPTNDRVKTVTTVTNHVPICYASRNLTACERRYSQTEREALALVWACERFHAYIYGTKFELVTDRKPLEGLKPFTILTLDLLHVSNGGHCDFSHMNLKFCMFQDNRTLPILSLACSRPTPPSPTTTVLMNMYSLSHTHPSQTR
jgi:hypothetical protein